MEFIANTLGIMTVVESWEGSAKLPYYLNDSYTFRKVTLVSMICLFMKPTEKMGTLPAIKKHISKISEIDPLPIVLELEGINAQQRRALIEARIPFVVDGSQIYLPFLGICLQEKYTEWTPPNKTLMPSAQMLLFYYLYQDKIEMFTSGISEKIGFTVMQISRAVKQLQGLGLVTVRKYGVKTVIAGIDNRSILFEKAKPYFMNPVRKRIYVDVSMLPNGLPIAGMSALSELTMINALEVKTFAYYDKSKKLTGIDTLIDSETQVEVEIWRYPPTRLSHRRGMVDPLSLIASFQASKDERTKGATEELLEEIWR